MKLRKFVVGASLAGLMALGVSVRALPAASYPQSQNSEQSSEPKTVSGKVASIASDHKSFSLQTDGGDTMQFALDQNTQVQGRVSTGTAATVAYQKKDDGTLLCLSVAPQGAGNNSNPQNPQQNPQQ